MKIAIIGGSIKGIELALLAKTAGIYTILIDKEKLTPASGLCAENYVFDVRQKCAALMSILKNVDIVVPALEDKAALRSIEEMCIEIRIKVAFDFVAHDITSVKIQADMLISEEKFPHLKFYPDADPPYILRPTEGSGRPLMRKVDTLSELEALMSMKDNPNSWIAQEYISGVIYAIEVIGTKGNYKTYEASEITLTPDFDYNFIRCPADLDENRKKTFEKYALVLAEKLQLNGILRIEALENDDKMKIVNIDAIFPSQTPVAILYSTGINMLVEMLKVYADDAIMEKLNKIINIPYEKQLFSARKNFQFISRTPSFNGERSMDTAGPLKIMVDFFGADYAVTDYIVVDDEWQAILINTADTEEKLTEKRIRSRELLFQHCRKHL